MARRGVLVLCSIWQDEDFTALPQEAQWLYLFLLGQPDVNHLGVLPLLPVRWAQALPGGDPQQILNWLSWLEQARFVVVDPINEALLIRSFLRNDDVARKPNILRAARSAIAALMSPKIAEALHTELVLIDEHDLPESVPAILLAMKEQLKALARKGSRNPSPNPSGNPLANPSKKGSANPLGARSKELGATEEVAVRARARGSRIPDPFPITPEMVAWARERTPGVDGRRETEKFINYWRAKTGAGATKLDWTATWRNWMLAAAERLPQARGPVSSGSTTDDRVAQALELAARYEQGEIES